MEANRSSNPSRWREEAQWRRDNEYWLKYSRNITLQVLRAMDTRAITQAELARRMGCTQQYVSNLLKGSSNMTLETIARLERALEIDILQSALSHVYGYNIAPNSNQCFLNDSGGEAVDGDIKTCDLVDGYGLRQEEVAETHE